ncbi:MAG: tetratricopeptide repeat protein [Gemmataceae bacterium]
MPIDSKRVQAVFLAAVEQADRAAILDRECGDDLELRRRVEALLKANDEPASYLDEPAVDLAKPSGTVDYAPISEKPGSMIGPYKLKEQIGEGGFGLVFVAEQQEPVKRKVALKVIKPGMDTREVMARFTAERQALALMDHPNIARVLDAGATESGRPYFVMELVRGIPITDYCDQSQLSPHDRLELFITVCQAVQHAHQKGIIHRDIKPSNVLVTSHDGKPVAKVIDFGIAKAINQQLTDRSIYTNFAQMIGTPLYMSPEQAEMSGLDIDTRSDIYSLGVLLYELLTGTTPLDKQRFAKAAYDEIRRMIREDEPLKPSTRLSTSASIASIAAQRHIEPAKLSKLMRGDLDWITMKALEKDRTRRYETASGLARDIQRYLSDEPVEACPPSSTYRLRKFARKNRATLTTATAIALLLVVGVTVSTWQAVRATRSEQVAMAARDAEAEQRQRAEANERKSIDAATAEKQAKEAAQAREAETKAVLDFVENKVFAAARPKDLDGGQGYEVKLADALKAALPFVEKSFTDQPLIEGRLRLTLGTSFRYLGQIDIAEQQFRRARDLFTTKLGPDHPDTLTSMNNLARSYTDLGRHPESVVLNEETLKRRKARLGPDHPDTLTSMANLATVYGYLGRYPEQIVLNEETLKRRKARLGPDHPDTLTSMFHVAGGYLTRGRVPEALALFEETLKLMKARLGPDHIETLRCTTNVADCYSFLGRHPEALAMREELLKQFKAKEGPDHHDTLTIMRLLANSYAVLGRHPEALAMREEAFKLANVKLGPDHRETLMSMCNLADSYFRLGRQTEALALREEALKQFKATLGPDHPQTLSNMNGLASRYADLGRHREALALYIEALNLWKARLGADHPGTVDTIYEIACVQALMIAKAEDRKKQADVAMDWIQQVVAAGFKDVAHMKKDTDLDPLRDREDFKKLIAELEAAVAEKKPGAEKKP